MCSTEWWANRRGSCVVGSRPHPYRWVAIVIGVIMVLGSPAIQHYSDVTEWALLAALAALFGVAGLAGALVTRHRVRLYDEHPSE